MNKTIIINKLDNVGVALTDLKKNETINNILLLDDIPCGHKFSLVDIKKNENIIKYGSSIGKAKEDIKKGYHIHTHNLKTNLDNNFTYTYKKELLENKFNEEIYVNVYKRKYNKYGIRNNIFIVPLVGCVNSTCDKIKDEFIKGIDASLIDDVIVLKHPYGCSQLGDDNLNTINTLKGIVKNPNAGGVLVVSLGCENNKLDSFIDSLGEYDEERVKFIKCQDLNDEIKTGVDILNDLYKIMVTDKREKAPLSVINIGLKCGGSDGFSGISANPLVGLFTDYLISLNGTAILTEVPEMFGAEQILMKRAKDSSTFDKIVSMINNFKLYYKNHNQVCYENPSPGNKEGGISTLEDKSLGCIEKAGHSYINDVLYTGGEIKEKGLCLLSGPGNDMVSSTLLASLGCQLILFTTGRGTPFGSFVPTFKISSNTKLFDNKSNWIDFNAGRLIDGEDIFNVFEDFKKYIINCINGTKTNNEKNKYYEIAIFKDGVTL